MEINTSLDDLFIIHSKVVALKKKPDRLKSFVQKLLEPKSIPSITDIYEIMMPPFTITKTREKRKLAARIIYDICSVNFDLLFLISETLNFSPLTGKVCLNTIPKALTDKFNSNHELYNELKQFIESSDLIESNKSSIWTFPDFKSTSNISLDLSNSESRKEIAFPDPKYYMIGLRVDKTEFEQENF